MEWAEDFGAIGDHSSLVRSASIRLPFFSTAIRHTRGLSALIPSFLEACRKRLRMETHAEERLAVSTITLGRSQDWVHHVISLVDAVDEALKALLADSMLTFHRVYAKTIEIRLLRRRTDRAN